MNEKEKKIADNLLDEIEHASRDERAGLIRQYAEFVATVERRLRLERPPTIPHWDRAFVPWKKPAPPYEAPRPTPGAPGSRPGKPWMTPPAGPPPTIYCQTPNIP